MDIAATGVISPMERTFFDARITHPNAPSNRSIPLNNLYVKHETEKKVKHEDRTVQVEKGSFSLAFSTSGGVRPLCDNCAHVIVPFPFRAKRVPAKAAMAARALHALEKGDHNMITSDDVCHYLIFYSIFYILQ